MCFLIGKQCFRLSLLSRQRQVKWDPAQQLISQHVYVLSTESCLTLFSPRDCSPSGSSVHGILQARSGLPFPSPGELPNPVSPALQVDSLPLNHRGSLNISELYPIWNYSDSHEFSPFNLKLPKSGQILLDRHNYIYKAYLKSPFFLPPLYLEITG